MFPIDQGVGILDQAVDEHRDRLMSSNDIDHMRGLGYARSDAEALDLVLSAAYDAAFFLRSTPVSQVQDIAAAGINMPPKTTYFYPKVPTGLVFNPLL